MTLLWHYYDTIIELEFDDIEIDEKIWFDSNIKW